MEGIKKWAVKKIDKIRRGFLWKGSEDVKGGHCLVRWAKIQKPKQLGGLGILDLELFGRALRLRWLWLEWTEPDRPWVGTEVPCNEVDKHLFRVSTEVVVGDGRRAKFWDSPWLSGQAPRDLAPNLYKLAWRKNQTVHDDTHNCNWTRGLWRMTTATEMAEFISLWALVSEVELSHTEDIIRWRWTANGHYSSRSAYKAQLIGSYCTFDAMAIWKAKTEGKHRFFAWLLVQRKILTADKLLARNWPCNPMCPLCDQEDETARHLCLQCVFAQEVWVLVAAWSDNTVTVPRRLQTLESWWSTGLAYASAADKSKRASIMIYTAWNIWKERNRRIFEAKTATPRRVFQLIKDEMALRASACEFAVEQVVS
jgi:hypothetical protein